jgi:hypothetical protein
VIALSAVLNITAWKNYQVSTIIKGEVVPVLNKVVNHEDIWGSGCIDPHIFDLGTSLQ